MPKVAQTGQCGLEGETLAAPRAASDLFQHQPTGLDGGGLRGKGRKSRRNQVRIDETRQMGFGGKERTREGGFARAIRPGDHRSYAAHLPSCAFSAPFRQLTDRHRRPGTGRRFHSGLSVRGMNSSLPSPLRAVMPKDHFSTLWLSSMPCRSRRTRRCRWRRRCG